jgi:Protein of unknown function (DUF3105)
VPETPTEHPRARRAVGVIVTVLVALAGGIGLLLFFVARDDAPVDSNGDETAEVRGPGQAFPDQGARHVPPGQRGDFEYNSDPPTSGPHVAQAVRRDAVVLTDDQVVHALELGNVVLAFGSADPPPALRRLALDISGPFDPALVQAGQAVLLDRRPGTNGVIALAWRHLLRTRSPTDPELRRFAEFWLGRGAGQ